VNYSQTSLKVPRAAALAVAAMLLLMALGMKAQVPGGKADSSLIKSQQAKPGFLSLLQDEEAVQTPTNLVADTSKKAAASNRATEAPKALIKLNPEVQVTPTISYKTFVMSEERKKLENRFASYINERYFNISVRKIVGYEDGSYATAQSELPGVLKVVRKNLPKVVSERFEVIVDVDTSSTKGDYQFFYNLINGIIAIDSEDIVKINFWKFPQAFIKDVPKLPSREELLAELKAENDLAKQQQPADQMAPQQLQQPLQSAPQQVESEDGQLEGLLERLLERDMERKEEVTPPTVDKSNTILWSVLIGVVVLLIIALLFIFLRGTNSKNKHQEVVDELELSSVGLKKIAEGVFDDNRPSMKKDEFKSHLLENPAAVAAFLNSIIEQNNDEALTVFSHLARPFPDLVGMTKPFMTYNNFLLVLSKLDQPGDEKIDSNSIDKFLVTFNSAVKVLSNSKSEDVDLRGGKVFGFLDQLSDNQVASLLSSDKPELASIVFAQLNRDRKLAVLENIDEELRSEILISLSDIKKMPLSIIKEVGIRYSKKAREVAGLEDVKIDGIKALVETLDELDYKKQVDIIDTMRASDLEKGERLERMFIGVNGLSRIPEDSLRSALSDLQTETIIRALYGLPADQVDYILQARPPRERELIKSELEVQPSFSSGDQISARKLVLQSVRKVVL
jgi:hypothetical protein